MNSNYVASIAFEESDNLGMGYLSSVLSGHGYKLLVLDIGKSREEILKKIRNAEPVLIGFSVIFQYHINKFRELINYLRESGINCHFTAGGHFASLRSSELLKIIPELDSLVRFEGEYTFLELTERLSKGEDWRDIKGLSYKLNGELINNSLRPLERNLDKFPFPARKKFRNYVLGRTYTTILAGRGCIHDCIFCDIREFYQQPPGPYKRIRTPSNVIDEMEYLFREKGCTVFIFQDDDFPVKTEHGDLWIRKFCDEISARDMKDKIMWKINCRPDEVDEKSFALMKDHGLFLVFLGIEDGTDEGLYKMNKKIRVSEIKHGIKTLKSLDIGFDYGFMLFQPDSTFESISVNLDFLRSICGDGYTPLSFLKMMPHFATKIEAILKAQDRLILRDGLQDYKFLSRELDDLHSFVFDVFEDWLLDPKGFLNISKWVRNYISVFSFYNSYSRRIDVISENLINLNAEANHFFLQSMSELLTVFKSSNYNGTGNKLLKPYRDSIRARHDAFVESGNKLIKNIVVLDQLKSIVTI
jgi:radical SAM superfamily enzyme YgiQ (UPF0313 family)